MGGLFLDWLRCIVAEKKTLFVFLEEGAGDVIGLRGTNTLALGLSCDLGGISVVIIASVDR